MEATLPNLASRLARADSRHTPHVDLRVIMQVESAVHGQKVKVRLCVRMCKISVGKRKID